MSAAEDGTIDLLTNAEGQLIAALGRNSVQTPTGLSRNLARSRYWVARDAEALRKLGLVQITRTSKQVTYELTGQGRLLIEGVEARLTRTGRFMTGEDFANLNREAEQGYCTAWIAGSHPVHCFQPLAGDGSCPNAAFHMIDQSGA
jgi:hypothetical protein